MRSHIYINFVNYFCNIYYYFCIVYSCATIVPATSSIKGLQCDLRWTGKWYSNELSEPLQIRRQSVDTFGDCVAMSDNQEHYLFRLQRPYGICYRCVTIFGVHRNVLRFKKTNCIRDYNSDESIEAVCQRNFRGVSAMSTMFKANASPEQCPFEAPLNFTYKLIDGSCTTRYSTITQCANSKRFRFFYKTCDEYENKDSHADELECIGSWTSFSVKYIAVRIVHSDIALLTSPYRCIVLEHNGYSGKMGISADASCSELTALSAASTILNYKPDSRITPQCEFPAYLSHDLHTKRSERWTSVVNDYVHTFTKEEWISENNYENVTVSSCISAENLGHTFKAMVYVTFGCSSGYQCIKVIKRKRNIVEIVRGKIYSEELSACDDFDEHHYDTLLLKDSKAEKCPVRGRFVSEECPSAKIYFGCGLHHSIQLRPICNASTTKSLVCRGHWVEDGVKYVIAEDKDLHETHCLVYSPLPDAKVRIRSHRHTACRHRLAENTLIFDFITTKPENCDLNTSSVINSSFALWLLYSFLTIGIIVQF